MLRTLIILPEAEDDANQAYRWYEEQETGLGEDFFRCIDARINSMQRNPEIYPTVHKSYRRGIVRRFPYVIFYECSDMAIVIYAIVHCSQDPRKWRSRLP